MKVYTDNITAEQDIAEYEEHKKIIRDNFEILQIVTQTKNGNIKISKEKKYTRIGVFSDPIVFEGLPRLNTFSGYAYYWDKYRKVPNHELFYAANGGAKSTHRRSGVKRADLLQNFMTDKKVTLRSVINANRMNHMDDNEIKAVAKELFKEYYDDNDAIYIPYDEGHDSDDDSVTSKMYNGINAYEVLFSQIISCCQKLGLNYKTHFPSIYSSFINHCEYNDEVLYDDELYEFVKKYDKENKHTVDAQNKAIIEYNRYYGVKNYSVKNAKAKSRALRKTKGTQKTPRYASHTTSSANKISNHGIPRNNWLHTMSIGGHATRKNKKNIT